ncbi:acyl-CoA dehydrogenase family protein [Aeromicrobium choanae]|uniref:Acyl-CoA dehydrogenase, C-terminal domain n=1 Tax=Aeromicrobium choanae TaxID=1736691 RepID=A0A1T4YWN6_9ACTN|nr:acyl-CoA dehydrogenase family protein [Aeromicrobium choanae]SKB06146.1 Acyl-CoA dehydrogenase, C-terminal domain [Aeromicrobium choanae]
MDRTELDLFAGSVAGALARTGGADVDAALAQVGWHDALQEWGGPAIGVVLEAQGRATATSGALDDVLATACGLATPHAVLLPRLGGHALPAHVDGNRITVHAHAGSRLAHADRVAILVGDDDEVAVIEVPAEALTRTAVQGIDPDLGLLSVTADLSRDEVGDGTEVDWDRVLAFGRIAVASELVGVARATLELGIDHANSRIQFGAPIAAFQAVRHRLADTFVTVEGAAAAVAACCDQAGPGGPEPLTPAHALMAKALAGNAARLATKHVQQVLAGIGFTAEHPFHHHLRRAMLLERMLGSTDDLTAETGRLAIAQGRVPMELAL